MESFYKDFDINTFECTTKLFDITDPMDLDSIFKIYDTDGYSIANLIQENYLDFNDSIESVANAAEAISLGETIFTDTYDSMKAFIPDYHCLSSMVLPSYYCRSHKKKIYPRTNCNNNRFNIYLNNKKILNKLDPLNIFDVLYLKTFVNNSLVKTKVLNTHQLEFLRNLLSIFPDSKIERLELIYKHFSEFKDLEQKTKNFTLKFKEKISQWK